MADHKKDIPPVNPNPDWQDRDIRVKTLVLALCLIALVIVLTMGGMHMLFTSYAVRMQQADQPVSLLATERILPEGVPLLQAKPLEELAAHRAAEDELLSTYGWSDQSLGVAHIPIERAMELKLEQGFPVREQE